MRVTTYEDKPDVVSAGGEIDLSNVDKLRDALLEAVDKSPKHITVDLSEVTYMDSAGIQAILTAYQRLYKNGGEITLIIRTASLKEIFEVTRLDALPGMHIRTDEETGP